MSQALDVFVIFVYNTNIILRYKCREELTENKIKYYFTKLF